MCCGNSVFFVVLGIVLHLDVALDGTDLSFEHIAPTNLVLLVDCFPELISVRAISEFPELFGMLVRCPVPKSNKKDDIHFWVCVRFLQPLLKMSEASINGSSVMKLLALQIVLWVLVVATSHREFSNVLRGLLL